MREWILSVLFAAVLGMLVGTGCRGPSARYLWIAGILVLLIGIAVTPLNAKERYWTVLSGVECALHRGASCIQFWSITVPFIRIVSYSLGSALIEKCWPDELAKVQAVVLRDGHLDCE